jgi:monovalent cation:H+ antiporter-2, CPA2 family
MVEAPLESSGRLIELGGSMPLYLLAGLAFGNGGLAPLNLSHDFAESGADLGVLLLLFMLGWKPLAAVLLGGVTYDSSSGVVAKVLGELGCSAIRAGLRARTEPHLGPLAAAYVLRMAIFGPILVRASRRS